MELLLHTASPPWGIAQLPRLLRGTVVPKRRVLLSVVLQVSPLRPRFVGRGGCRALSMLVVTSALRSACACVVVPALWTTWCMDNTLCVYIPGGVGRPTQRVAVDDVAMAIDKV